MTVSAVGLRNGMNSRQLADAICAPRPELPVLFVTGYAENAVLNHGHLARRVKELVGDDGPAPK